MDSINRVYELLKPLGVPVKYLLRPNLEGFPYVVSFHFFNDHQIVKGGGRGRLFGGFLQVDIFSEEPTRPHYRKIVELLEKGSFYFFDFEEYPDDSIKGIRLYHGKLIMTCRDERIKNYG